jgi:outer membrane receptor protein involved in Fe transport
MSRQADLSMVDLKLAGAVLSMLHRHGGAIALKFNCSGPARNGSTGRNTPHQAANHSLGEDKLAVLTQRSRLGLLVTTAVGSALTASLAFAQAAQPAENNNQRSDLNQLEEVVVTATRQADTVNRVPLAVTAQTQRNLDQQGIRSVRDLENLVPSLQTSQSLQSGAAQFSLRGIVQGGAGAATTGFYLDDTSLQKRNVGGGVFTANGTPLPPLFDLDRVEVLRGPQGTLFGGGSEGGTIRYIQPAPSLTRYSSYARAQASVPEKGDASYQAGVAVGGPIIQDKLGFRASVFAGKTGGYIDLIDPLTRKEVDHNANSQTTKMFRTALTWAPTERLRVTADFFSSSDRQRSGGGSYNLDVPGTTTVPTTCFNTRNTPVSLGNAANGGFSTTTGLGTNNAARVGPIESLPIGQQGRLNPYPVARGDANCAAAAARGDVTFTVPGFSYGPYDLDRYDSIATSGALSPAHTNLQIGSLTLNYEFDKMSVKSITSYIDDETKSVASQQTPQGGLRSSSLYVGPDQPNGILGTTAAAYNPWYLTNPTGQYFGTSTSGFTHSWNKRWGLTQELRFSSAGDAKPFSWVAGVFFSNIRGTAGYDNYNSPEFWAQRKYGVTNLQLTGVNGIESAPGLFNNYDQKRQNLKDIEIAAFAEGNYWITDKLRATAGVRVSRVSFTYYQTFSGPVTGVGPTNPNPALQVLTEANGGKSSGTVAESPVTPKFGLNYQINDNSMVYVTAAKGFRAGGINAQVSQGICGDGLERFGITPADLPSTYESDSVWSYELGAKLRFFNRVQVNAAVYQIDWANVQITQAPPGCGLSPTFNGDGARSRGVELEANARVFRGLTVNGAFGYNDTRYTSTTVVIQGRPNALNGFTSQDFTISLKDQKFALPPWTLSVGARYEMDITSKARGYVRGDYRYSKGYLNNPFGTTGYNPDSNVNPSIFTANLRAGVEYGDFDINLFVNNLLDRKRGNIGGGRTGCTLPAAGGTPACNTPSTNAPNGYTGYSALRTINTGTPREFGIQIAFRH